MTVRVVTDSSASLPPDLIHRFGIAVVPFNLVIDGVAYSDGELSSSEVAANLGHKKVSTSAPSPGAFAKAFDDGDPDCEVVVITVASRMSASYGSAVVASRYFREGRVDVVDSGTAAGAQGLTVLAAAKRAASGVNREEVAAVARDVAARVRLVAAVEKLDFLARSGRIPAVAAWAGNSLTVRPLFEFAAGKARPLRPALGIKAALDRIVGSMGVATPSSCVLRVAVMHAGTGSLAHRLAERMRAAYPEADIFRAPFSSVMTAHTGPGLVGAAWWWDDCSAGSGRELWQIAN